CAGTSTSRPRFAMPRGPASPSSSSSCGRSMWRSRSTSASELVLGAWLLAALVTLLTADEVKGWLRADGRFVGLGAAVEHASRRVGLAGARDALDVVRGLLYGRRPAPRSPVLRAPVMPAFAAPPPAPHRVAPAAHRILLIGASSMQFGLGPELERALGRYRGVTIRRFARSATGLSRPNEFDWPARLDELLASFGADTVIANFGGNDATAIFVGPGKEEPYGTPAWDRLFEQRVAQLVEHAAAHGAHMIMIGMPIMKLPKFNERIQKLNQLMRAATLRSGGDYVDQ